MTTSYPELPEPWNNLAALYAGRGELEKRRTPCKWRCAPIRLRAARANLGDLQLLQALRTYKQAASDGVPGMQDKAREVETMLKENKANDVELFSPAPAAPDGLRIHAGRCRARARQRRARGLLHPSTTEGTKSMSTNPRVKLHTNQGDIVITLDAAKAPKTVANFLTYTKEGFYNGTVFHRVIDGFMVQGGGFEPGMKQKQTHAPIENEANNGLKNDKYTLAMARTSDPHSATAQFFINVSNNDFLNFTAPTPNGWGYAVFGTVTEGTDVVDKIKGVKTGNKGFHQNVPNEDVIIEKAEVLE